MLYIIVKHTSTHTPRAHTSTHHFGKAGGEKTIARRFSLRGSVYCAILADGAEKSRRTHK